MKLAILDGNAVNPGDLSWDAFKKYADVTVYPRTSEKDVISRIGSSDAVFLNKIKIDKNVVSHCPTLKYIGVLATGYNVIDLEATKNAHICVTNIPSYSTDSVAQHVFALILHFSNQVDIHNASVQNGDWIKCDDFCYWKTPLIELAGKTLGILGYGSIGKKVEKIATAFGMKTIICPHHLSRDIKNCVDFETLLEQSDFLTLHVPLTRETEKIINKDTISKMKNGVYLINTARGGVVNENDVREALENGKISGFACDVLENEPMKQGCPLFNAPNCVITPHIAWASKETRIRLQAIALNNFVSWLQGKPENVVY